MEVTAAGSPAGRNTVLVRSLPYGQRDSTAYSSKDPTVVRVPTQISPSPPNLKNVLPRARAAGLPAPDAGWLLRVRVVPRNPCPACCGLRFPRPLSFVWGAEEWGEGRWGFWHVRCALLPSMGSDAAIACARAQLQIRRRLRCVAWRALSDCRKQPFELWRPSGGLARPDQVRWRLLQPW
eukprot:COSAG01_NODE_3848_length_5639_cov_59.210251_3_plen_180_part_00